MKLTTERDALHGALSRARKAIGRGPTIPILEMLRLEAGDDSLSICATDMRIMYRETIDAQVSAEGATCVGAQQLYGIAASATTGSQVELSLGQSQLGVKAGSARFRLATLPVEDFPVLPDLESEPVVIDAKSFLDALSRCLPAASNDPTRYYMCGVHLCERGDKLLAVATDGHRLARAEIGDVRGLTLPPDGLTLPRLASGLAGDLFDGADSLAAVMTDAAVSLSWGRRYLRTSLVEGSFPDWERVVTQPKFRVNVDSSELKVAVSRLLNFGDRKGSDGIGFRFEGNKLFLATETGDGESGSDEVAAEGEDCPSTFGLNGRYVLSMLESCQCETITLGIIDEHSPILFTSPTDNLFSGIVMAMRIGFVRFPGGDAQEQVAAE